MEVSHLHRASMPQPVVVRSTSSRPCFFVDRVSGWSLRSSVGLTQLRSGRWRRSCSASSSETLVAEDHGKRMEVVSKKDYEIGDLKLWMEKNGLPPVKVVLRDRPSHDEKLKSIHYVAASEDLQAGDVAFSVPNSLVVTLERVLGNESIAELLTTNKLSELACLALYLMYEKKQGKKSFWYPYIRELDRQRGRGQLAVESPLLWSEAELDYLTGSPTKAEVIGRAEGIKREYNELDTVWFMAGSLFQQYPYDIPTEAFPFEIFKQAFVAVQSCVVHLQKVSLARRFALVPLGPPLLTYRSNCKAMLTAVDGAVQLVVDRPYKTGDPIVVWCGPQPNSKLLLNYGFVDEDNPYDRIVIEAALNTEDPQYQDKRMVAQRNGKLSLQNFNVSVGKEKEAILDMLPYLRLGYLTNASELAVKCISHDNGDGVREFLAEISSLGRLKHRNLVGLRGWCKREKGSFMLVYDYMENGSLDKRVFGCDESEMLTYEDRIRVLKNVATGVLYLHEGWDSKVLHRDIKASNVLLDKEMNGRLGDFGLARMHGHEQVPNTTRVVGTIGYLAPEVIKRGRVSTQSDVFGFGILILEVLCGKRPIQEGQPPLVDWVWHKMKQRQLISVLDERLIHKGGLDQGESEKILHLGMLCAYPDPTARPTMRQVVRILEGGAHENDDKECEAIENCLLNPQEMWSKYPLYLGRGDHPTFNEIKESISSSMSLSLSDALVEGR